MASDAAVENLAKQFQTLPPLEEYPNCFPKTNPVDIYRSHVSTAMSKITGVDAKIIYPALQWTSTLDKGDMALRIPALRIKGKPDVLGQEWVSKACCPSSAACCRPALILTACSGPNPPWLRPPCSLELSSPSSSNPAP